MGRKEKNGQPLRAACSEQVVHFPSHSIKTIQGLKLSARFSSHGLECIELQLFEGSGKLAHFHLSNVRSLI